MHNIIDSATSVASASSHSMVDITELILAILLISILALMLGLVYENSKHKNNSLATLTHLLKSDIASVVKALFSKTVTRHTFDSTLCDDISTQIKSSAKVGFYPQIINNLWNDVPCIRIKFVPDKLLTDAELSDIIQAISLKFIEYLQFYSLNWSFFIVYSIGANYINIYICYCEADCDQKSYRNLYRRMIRKKSEKNFGLLRDDSLDAELRNVN